MKIGITKLNSISFGEHVGIHIYNIPTYKKAVLYRNIILQIMDEVYSTGSIFMNLPNESNNNYYELFLYNEKNSSLRREIEEKLANRL